MQSCYVFDKGGVFQYVFFQPVQEVVDIFQYNGWICQASMAGSPATSNVIWFVTESMVSLIGTFVCRY